MFPNGNPWNYEYIDLMKNTLIGVLAAVALAVIGYFIWAALSQPVVPSEEVPATETKNAYATSTFTIQYPSSYTLNDTYAYEQFKGKPIAGVKFLVPESLASGTNLSSSDTGVSVESLPRAKNCTGDIYIFANVKAVDLTVGSTTYSVATSTGAAAGNTYEEQVFAIKGSSPCTAVRYFIHSSNIGNFAPAEGDTTSTKEFDRSALLRAFDDIRDSLVLGQ